MTSACVVCGFDLVPTEIRTCALCVSLVRLDLTQVEHCFALLPSMLGRPDGASLGAVMGGLSGEAALPGGDVLAMLGPGGERGEGLPSDPPAVAFELWQWREDWAEIRGEAHDHETYAQAGIQVLPERAGRSVTPGHGSRGHSVPALVAWLGLRLSWAGSHHPAFDCFAADMARIRFRLELVTEMVDRPERGESCPYCGVTLLREYGNQGRVDDWWCRRCRLAFDEAQYRLAVAQALAGAAGA
jgi:hypothetical protein